MYTPSFGWLVIGGVLVLWCYPWCGIVPQHLVGTLHPVYTYYPTYYPPYVLPTILGTRYTTSPAPHPGCGICAPTLVGTIHPDIYPIWDHPEGWYLCPNI